MTTTPEITRLNKYLALHLGVSRREADDLIDRGKVTVDGVTAVLGARVPSGGNVQIDGTPVLPTTEFTYLLLHKPRGYICSRRQQGDAETIYALLPPEYHNLKPVGRLDKDSSGLVLLTNDGDFAYQMTHPKFYKTKIYLVALRSELEPLHQQMISDYGVTLEDGPSKLSLERLSPDHRRDWRITMTEGRNRQIRRTFGSLGYEVAKLHRTNFGDYSLGDIEPGSFEATTIH